MRVRGQENMEQSSAGSWDGNIISSRTLHLLGRRQGKVMEGVLNINPNEKG